jgi:diacylglycerol kinase (ATP)
MTRVAVIAHAGKSFGGGLPELRRTLAEAGISDPIWHEVPKSRKAPKQVRRALKEGAELLIVWGGDGMVQRCVDALSGSDATLAILPAGTANLFAGNLGIPQQIAEAVQIALSGDTRTLDVARMNGERFAVMAGAGFDARMIRGADGGLKDRLGRVAYVFTGARALRAKPFRAEVEVDGATWFKGKASCVLFGNVGALFGGITVFEDARPDDGLIDLGVITADGLVQWTRTAARTAVGSAADSPFVQVTKARSVRVKLDRKVLYELDGGDREKARKFRVEVEPAAVRVRVPAPVT